jgi:FMN phosphatase YigB (HAD superfamily)
MRKDIRFVYFDLGRVVVDNEASIANLAIYFHVSGRTIEKFFHKFVERACKGHISSRKLLTLFEQFVGIHSGARDFAQLWGKYLVPIKQTHDLIYEISRRIAVGALTDIEHGVFRETVRNGGIPDIPWAAVIESCKLGYMKPDKRIYTYAQEQAHVSAKNIFYTDDKPENVTVAKSLGWKSTLFVKEDIRGSIQTIRRMLHI